MWPRRLLGTLKMDERVSEVEKGLIEQEKLRAQGMGYGKENFASVCYEGICKQIREIK